MGPHLKRSTLLFLIFLLLQLAVLASQTGDRAGGGPLDRLTLALTAPLTHGVEEVEERVSGLRARFRLWGRLQEENRELRAEVEQLRYELMRSWGLEGQLQRLESALAYEHQQLEPLAVADVVLADTGSWLESLIIFAGAGGLETDQPVVTTSGVVGRTIQVAGRYAKVQLITDRTAAVGARIERTRRQGLVTGTLDGGLALRLVPRQETVRTGDRVLTSGTDGIYPRGLPIGVVRSVSPGDELFLEIRLDPAVDLTRLDQVYVLPRRDVPARLLQEPAPRREETDAAP